LDLERRDRLDHGAAPRFSGRPRCDRRQAMPDTLPTRGLQLTSTVTPAGELELQLAEAPVPEPGPDQVLIRVEAAPINPSDLMILLGPGSPAAARFEGAPGRPKVTIPLPPAAVQALARRLGAPLVAGNEGAGVVVAAGERAKALRGKKVAALAG